jgi:hypothetical protein
MHRVVEGTRKSALRRPADQDSKVKKLKALL